jgi:hypothetical protein
MISELDRNRLYGEKSALQDEVAEAIRLANVPSSKIAGIMDFVEKQHNECIKAIKDGEMTPDEAILALRGLVRNVINS